MNEWVKGNDVRTAGHGVDPLFVNRWSPRAMSGAAIAQDDLNALFEAARWAPSAFNNQPWRILYARRETPQWPAFFDLLTDTNKAWCDRGAALVLFISQTTFDHSGAPSHTHSFDCGAAWENLALQGWLKGFVVHGMQGFAYDRAREALGIPDGFRIEAMCVVGMPAARHTLPVGLQEKEVPKGRRPLAEIVCEGPFRL